jgi:hypothetical protein
MRLISLFIVLLIIAWLAYRLGGQGTPEAQPAWKQAEVKAAAVDPMVQDQFAKQAETLSRMETGQAPENQ